MSISVFDLFKIGIGPSSSHTVGPMRAARQFVLRLQEHGLLDQTMRVQSELFGSLGATGKGHGSDRAVLLGLEGDEPDRIDPATIPARLDTIRSDKTITLLGGHAVPFNEKQDLLFRRKSLPFHPNGMTFSAFDAAGSELLQKSYYSVGGGFVVDEAASGAERVMEDRTPLPHPFTTGDGLLQRCREYGLSISDVMLANEEAWRSEAETRAGLLHIWRTMQECVDNGLTGAGTLPGGLHVPRRAAELAQRLRDEEAAGGNGRVGSELQVMDWVNVWAIAVNEENAAGGRVVTAPTNGAAGIVPAVLHYWWHFRAPQDASANAQVAREEGVVRFLLVAAAIGILYKENASISGADVGCQGEVGVACSMAAGGLAELLGGTPLQVENAAEIGMEHNLGLTCDPIGGLVQIPCIERNAMGAVKAINAARMALRGTGEHFVSLDKVIKTMRETGRDMKSKYKETARGGLAVNVIEC